MHDACEKLKGMLEDANSGCRQVGRDFPAQRTSGLPDAQLLHVRMSACLPMASS